VGYNSVTDIMGLSSFV